MKKAFVLAAGLGKRMRPLTDSCPKPLLEVAGRTMLDRALDALEAVGVEEAVVNTYYLGPMVEAHLQNRAAPHIVISREEKLLDTGGGVRRKLDFFGGDPFFVINGDNVWTDGPGRSALQRMIDAWDPEAMDILLLMHPTTGKGDYYIPDGSDIPVFNKRSDKPANFIFAGPRIVHPRLFDGETREAFSFLDLFHKAEAAGRLRGLRHDGGWHHVGTPEAYEETNRLLAAQPAKGMKCVG